VKDELQVRIGNNESIFRQINEGIERGQWPGEENAPVGFRCECARLGCNELLELSVREYEEVRSDPRRFMVVPGHERPDAEVVVERHPGYLVVEKRDRAGAIAADNDPRS
jgi:hypothetical protein